MKHSHRYFLIAVSWLFTVALVIIDSSNCFAQNGNHIIRIRFAAASQSKRTEIPENNNLDFFTSTASYDAFWEAEVPANDFPSAFGEPTVTNASGHVTVKTKNGLGDCDVVLGNDPSRRPTAEPYNFNGNIVTIRIATPHTAAVGNPAGPLGCRAPIFSYFADTDKNETVTFNGTNGGTTTTTITPANTGFPLFPVNVPLDLGGWAVFQVDIAKPSTSVSFTFEQRTDLVFTDNMIKWRGFVTVEVNPTQSPAPTDPFTFFQKDPPYHPTPVVVTPVEDKRDPIEVITSLLGPIGNIIKSRSKSKTKTVIKNNPDGSITVYSDAEGVVTQSNQDVSVAGSLGGSFSVQNDGSPNPSNSVIKPVALIAGLNPPITIKVPKALKTALKNGLASTVKITLKFKPADGSAAVKRTSKFKLKKRK